MARRVTPGARDPGGSLEPVRVVYFHDTGRIGGAERQLSDLASGLARSGHDAHIVTTAGPMVPFLRDQLREGVGITVAPARPAFDVGLALNTIRAVMPAARLGWQIRRLRPDIVHLNNGGFPGSHLCRAVATVVPRPTVMTVHAVPRPRRARLNRVQRLLDGTVWRSLDAVVCGTEATGTALLAERELPERLLRVIPYGVRAPESPPDTTAALRRELAPGDELLIGMVVAPDTGPDVVYKGHGVLLEALGLMERTTVRAVLVGHLPDEGFFQRARDLRVDGRVVAAGRVAEIAPYMAAFDLLVVPSTRHESLPLVVLEAMGAGIPVVASRLAGLPEAVVDGVGGYTFSPGDHRALAEILDRLAEDRNLVKRLGAGGRELFDRRFSVDAMVAATTVLYEELARDVSRA